MLVVDKEGTLKNPTPILVDANNDPLHERIEVTINKQKLQYAGWLLMALLSILSTLTWKVLDGVDTLKQNSADFKTYIQTNDQRVLYLERKLEEHAKDSQERDTRLKRLEEKESDFWKEHGWRFIERK